MLRSVLDKASYVTAAAAIAAENRTAASVGTEQTSDAARALSLQAIKSSIAKGILTKQQDLARSVTQVEPTDVKQGSIQFTKLESFDSRLEVYAAVEPTAAEDAPIVRVQMTQDGATTEYLVDISSIDTSDMTRVEAFALMRWMQSSKDWSDLTYTDMLAAIAAMLNGGAQQEPQLPTDAAVVDELGRYMKSANTYTASGAYTKSTANADSGIASFFEQTSSQRMQVRAMQLQKLLSNITVGKDGKRTLADGIYL